jgi:hypothetical protein
LGSEGTDVPDQSSEHDFLEVRRDEYIISSNPSKLDLKNVLKFLTTEAYWSQGIDPTLITKALENSLVPGLFDDSGKQVGFARVVTDYALFAYPVGDPEGAVHEATMTRTEEAVSLNVLAPPRCAKFVADKKRASRHLFRALRTEVALESRRAN